MKSLYNFLILTVFTMKTYNSEKNKENERKSIIYSKKDSIYTVICIAQKSQMKYIMTMVSTRNE